MEDATCSQSIETILIYFLPFQRLAYSGLFEINEMTFTGFFYFDTIFHLHLSCSRGAGGMSQWVNRLTTLGPSSTPGITWWKERTHYCKLPFDIHKCSMHEYALVHKHTINKFEIKIKQNKYEAWVIAPFLVGAKCLVYGYSTFVCSFRIDRHLDCSILSMS